MSSFSQPIISTPSPKKAFTLSGEDFRKESCAVHKINVSEWEGIDKYVVQIDGVLTAEECQALITFTEEER